MRSALKTLIGKEDLVGVEIGVDSGLNALNILENLNIRKLYLIDPWKHYGGMTGHGALPDDEELIRKCFDHAKKLLENYEHKLTWIIDFSENAIEFINEELDFVYIDGNHRYEYIKKDIELYFPKIKIGGLIGGHDHKGGELGIVFAVHESFGNKIYKDNWDWWYIKDE